MFSDCLSVRAVLPAARSKLLSDGLSGLVKLLANFLGRLADRAGGFAFCAIKLCPDLLPRMMLSARGETKSNP